MTKDSLLFTRLLRPLRIHQRRRIVVRQEADQVRRLLEGLDALRHFGEQAIGNVLGEHHLAGGRGGHGDGRKRSM